MTTQVKTFSSASNVRRFLKSLGCDLSNGRYNIVAVGDRFSWEDTKTESATATYKGESETLPVADLGEAIAKAAKPAKAEKPSKLAHARYAKINRSEQEKPCRFVWDMADANPEMKRAEVIALCVSFGVAYYTARTQYQAWRASQS